MFVDEATGETRIDVELTDEAVRLLGLQAARDTGRPVEEIISAPEWRAYLQQGEFEKLTDFDGMDAFPMWHGGRIYFISDLSGRLSLYVMDVGGSVPEPLLPPHIALQNPHHLNGEPYAVLPELGKILVMIDQDGDENYQAMFIPLTGGIPTPAFGERFAGCQVTCSEVDPARNLAVLTVDQRTVKLPSSSLFVIPYKTGAAGGFGVVCTVVHCMLLHSDALLATACTR